MPAQLSPSEALGLWHRVSTTQVIDDQPDLTLRQTAILLQIYLVTPPHTVRGLAATMESPNRSLPEPSTASALSDSSIGFGMSGTSAMS